MVVGSKVHLIVSPSDKSDKQLGLSLIIIRLKIYCQFKVLFPPLSSFISKKKSFEKFLTSFIFGFQNRGIKIGNLIMAMWLVMLQNKMHPVEIRFIIKIFILG